MSLQENIKGASEALAKGIADAASVVSSVAVDTGKKAIKAASEGAEAASDAIQKKQQEMRVERYSPVFPKNTIRPTMTFRI